MALTVGGQEGALLQMSVSQAGHLPAGWFRSTWESGLQQAARRGVQRGDFPQRIFLQTRSPGSESSGLKQA